MNRCKAKVYDDRTSADSHQCPRQAKTERTVRPGHRISVCWQHWKQRRADFGEYRGSDVVE